MCTCACCAFDVREGDYVYARPALADRSRCEHEHRGVVTHVRPGAHRVADTLLRVVFDDVPESVQSEQECYLDEVRVTRQTRVLA